jgi:signal peptidase I
MTWHRLAVVARVVVAVAVLGAVGWAGAWRLGGGQWAIVSTPSMGTAAPVGTLLWIEPVAPASVRVGDIVTFHPSTDPSTPSSREVTHRVVARRADGTFVTQGDINRTVDPWVLHGDDLVGRVTQRWWGIGWLVKAMPILAGGGLVLWALVRWGATPRWRAPLLLVGASVLVSLSLWVVKPLVRAELVSAHPVPSGGEATFVSTGLLPIRLEAVGSGHVDARSGEVRTLVAHTPTATGRYEVHVGAHIPLWWWMVGALVVLSPALWTLVVGLPPVSTGLPTGTALPQASPGSSGRAPANRSPRRLGPAATLVVLAALLGLWEHHRHGQGPSGGRPPAAWRGAGAARGRATRA